jgi:CDP-diacylglycerol--glycerol-3-phosphate 3-phosphatidyltransferase
MFIVKIKGYNLENLYRLWRLIIVLYLPNLLTFLRILLIPVIIYSLLIGNYFLTGIIFSIAALTDFLDGYLARKYSLSSKLGSILDPLADKLTIISVLLVLGFLNIIPRIISIIILSREIFILCASCVVYFMKLDIIKSSKLGKLSITLLYIAIAVKLLNFDGIDMILFYIVIPLNIISAIDYIQTALKKIYN